ncbi:MAG: phosphate ABC transporter permease subunit PstC [Candidatus Eremiobacteraeota bacterium]|nr:phosphate ABC transporter permease subunit PstC [Candidatus Eremiobacteraeota bacterium]
MATVALSGAAQRRSRVAPLDIILRYGTTTTAVATAAIVFLVALFLAIYAYPAIVFNGFGILTHFEWNLGNQYGTGVERHGGFTGAPGASFGAFVFILGTLVSSALAMAIATPLAILVAVAMHYRVPKQLKTPVNTLVELMAGVPSVVYGLWGVGVLVPWIASTVGPFFSAHVPGVSFIGAGAASGNGLLATGFILAVMIFPIMAATMRDVISTFPTIIFEGAIGLGATPWQSVTTLVLPAIRTQMFAAAMLALGRAVGETMAVLMVCGSALNQLPQTIFAPINTIAAVIVSQLDSALTDPTGMAERSLAEIALLLFAITLTVNLLARLIMRGGDRVKRTA